MSDPYIWGAMNRALNDATTIDQAIAEAVAAHNDEPEAHLDEAQSLETHRGNDVIDHPAESVVNDKVAYAARAYVAIVDPTDENSYATIQGAIDYATGVGGGNILIKAGLHYLTGQIEMPASINLIGDDEDSVTISGGYAAGNYIRIVDDVVNPQRVNTIQNITVVTTGGGVFYNEASDISNDLITNYNFCSFTGGGQYIFNGGGELRFNDCFIESNSTYSLNLGRRTTFTRCVGARQGSSSTSSFLELSANLGTDDLISFVNTVLDMSGATTVNYIGGTYECFASYYESRFVGWSSNGSKMYPINAFFTYFSFKTNHDLFFSPDGNNGLVIGCTFAFFGTGKLTDLSSETVFIGNSIAGSYSEFASDQRVYGDLRIQPYVALSTSTTAMGLQFNRIAKLTPNSTRTLTTTAALPGEIRQIFIETSGASSYTLTFGSGFKSTGTLATGVTTARRFCISFVSDGTNMIEISRTIAMAL